MTDSKSAILSSHKLITALLAIEFALVLWLSLFHPEVWPRDDSVTYFTQGQMLWLGDYPENPARPVFYPFLISLGMGICGLSGVGLRIMQGLFACLSLFLVYRLALKVSGHKAARTAALLYFLFPDMLFFSSRFYRESLTAFFLILTLNMIQVMLARPRVFTSLIAGVASGMLVLIKPEAGLLLAVLAIIGAVRAFYRRDLKNHFLPWVVCGLMALLTVFPAILSARAAYGEWIFINTYKGYTYVWAWCGIQEAGPEDEGKSFNKLESERVHRVIGRANNILFFSDPEIPYSKRDKWLLNKAKECVKEHPRAVASIFLQRLLHAPFKLDSAAGAWIRGGDLGRNWPPILERSITALALLASLLAVILAGPGVAALVKDRQGHPAAVTLIWYVLFYSTVLYVTRYRISIWPALAVVAGAGLPAATQVFRTHALGKTAALVIWIAFSLACVFAISGPAFKSLVRPAGWTSIEFGQGLSPEHQRWLLQIMADEFYQAREYQLMQSELEKFIKTRGKTLHPDVLKKTGVYYLEKGMLSTAAFFFRKAAEFQDDKEARKMLQKIRDSERTISLSDWEPAAKTGETTVYRAALPETVFVNPEFPPIEMQLRYQGRGFTYVADPEKEDAPVIYVYILKGRDIFITLPPDGPPPDSENPATFHYFALPSESLPDPASETAE